MELVFGEEVRREEELLALLVAAGRSRSWWRKTRARGSATIAEEVEGCCNDGVGSRSDRSVEEVLGRTCDDGVDS